jgi:hypothetical protein
MKNQTFNDLMESYDKALLEAGVGCSARLAKLQRSKVITKRHEAAGKNRLDNAIIAEYMKELSDRFDAGEVGKDHSNTMRREIEQFTHFVKTGSVKLPNPSLGARVILSPEFQKIADDFLKSDAAMLGANGIAVKNNNTTLRFPSTCSDRIFIFL